MLLQYLQSEHNKPVSIYYTEVTEISKKLHSFIISASPLSCYISGCTVVLLSTYSVHRKVDTLCSDQVLWAR
jgi:hypothetical protein